MRTAASELSLVRPRSLDHALELMSEHALTPIAGCTDVLVSMNFGTLGAKRFLDITPLDELKVIARHGATLTIGALATYTDMIASPLVREHVPMLVDAARQVGGIQIQNRGTIGGNVANGSPAGDTLPVLAAADAVVVLRGARGTRRVPFTTLYSGYRQTVMQPDELITAVELPGIDGRQWFRKVGTRAAQAISKLVMAAVRGPRSRVAIGSVAPTVVRLPRTEAALAAGASIDDAARIMGDEIAPIDDVRSTAAYRRAVAANLLKRFWSETA